MLLQVFFLVYKAQVIAIDKKDILKYIKKKKSKDFSSYLQALVINTLEDLYISIATASQAIHQLVNSLNATMTTMHNIVKYLNDNIAIIGLLTGYIYINTIINSFSTQFTFSNSRIYIIDSNCLLGASTSLVLNLSSLLLFNDLEDKKELELLKLMENSKCLEFISSPLKSN